MATVVEHPTSALSSQPSSQPQTQRNSIEIIDVDHFPSPDLSRRLSRNTPRSARTLGGANSENEVISLIDSDDDEPIIISSPRAPSNRGSRSRIRSPPPPRGHPFVMVPPVPRVPSQYAGQASFPLRRHAPPFPSGVVRANNEPFPFEHAIERQHSSHAVAGPSNASSSNSSSQNSQVEAAPPSHHMPLMGFGGAILSTRVPAAQRRAGPRTVALRNAINRNSSAAGQHGQAGRQRFVMGSMLHRLFGGENDEPRYPHTQTVWTDLFGDTDNGPAFLARMDDPETQGLRLTELYKPAYTHPQDPEPGFTFDFAPPSSNADRSISRLFPATSIDDPIVIDDSDDQPSSSAAGPSSASFNSRTAARSTSSEAGGLTYELVCARCSQPLLLNEGMSSEEVRDRRVWALRCGHLIDEKCLVEIDQPSDFFSAGQDKKGKGKRKEPPPYAVALMPSNEDDSEGVDVPTPPEPDTIRSRLRSRIQSVLIGAPAPPPPPAPPQPPAKKRRTTKKAHPKIEAQHEWTCPVASCGRVHVSIKVDDVWGPEKEQTVGKEKLEGRGVVPIFA